jgi:hypothetical protein
MPKNIVATPAAVVAVDRLILQADDARGDLCSVGISGAVPSISFPGGAPVFGCFSEE